jgi:thymidylate kinase
MIIVIEGADASGKSTLAKKISYYLGWPVISSEGPEKYPGEIVERIRRYNRTYTDNVIFDRHPCVSQPIYGSKRNGEVISSSLIQEFYSSKPYFIYCEFNDKTNHIEKDRDTQEHLQMIKNFKDQIRLEYEQWAEQHASIRYKIGDPVSVIIGQIGESR